MEESCVRNKRKINGVWYYYGYQANSETHGSKIIFSCTNNNMTDECFTQDK